jgi:hypothetical protein
MRIIAAIYLTIMLVNLGLWLASGTVSDPFPNISSYVMWSLYGFSVLALLAFVLERRILPKRAWQAVFVTYLGYRLVELMTTGLAIDGASPVISMNMVTNYLWFVVPPGLAMWYMGVMPVLSRSRPGYRSSPFRLGHPGAQQ